MKAHLKVPFSIIAIGIATLLLNASTVMVFGLSAIYMKTVLDIHTGVIGFLEGFVEALAYFTKLFSGVISDFARTRKSVMVVGFLITTISRPVLAFFLNFYSLFASRMFDRIGNGIQSTPRDALIADLSPENMKGRCYGLRQSLGTAGSVFGGVIGFFAIKYAPDNFKFVFFIASIPSILGLIVLIFFVKENDNKVKRVITETQSKKIDFSIKTFSNLSSTFWYVLLVAFVFMLSRFGESMILLHSKQNFNIPLHYTSIILIIYNAGNTLSTYPIGILSDKISRYKILLLGFFALVISDLFMAYSTNIIGLYIGVVLWGVQIGITQSMFLTIIADNVEDKLRGTAIGLFYLVSSITHVISNTMAGSIAHYYSEKWMFITSAVVGVLSMFVLIFLLKKGKLKDTNQKIS